MKGSSKYNNCLWRFVRDDKGREQLWLISTHKTLNTSHNLTKEEIEEEKKYAKTLVHVLEISAADVQRLSEQDPYSSEQD